MVGTRGCKGASHGLSARARRVLPSVICTGFGQKKQGRNWRVPSMILAGHMAHGRHGGSPRKGGGWV